MVKRIPESLPGACGGWPGSEPDDRARQKPPQKPLKNLWEISIFESDPPKIIEKTMKNGRSVRTVRTNRPYGPSVRTVRTHGKEFTRNEGTLELRHPENAGNPGGAGWMWVSLTQRPDCMLTSFPFP